MILPHSKEHLSATKWAASTRIMILSSSRLPVVCLYRKSTNLVVCSAIWRFERCQTSGWLGWDNQEILRRHWKQGSSCLSVRTLTQICFATDSWQSMLQQCAIGYRQKITSACNHVMLTMLKMLWAVDSAWLHLLCL